MLIESGLIAVREGERIAWGEKPFGNVFVKPTGLLDNSRDAVLGNCNKCPLSGQCIVEVSPARSNSVYGKRKADIVPVTGYNFLKQGCLFTSLPRANTNNIEIPT